MALNSLFCADVPLSNYTLTHSRAVTDGAFQNSFVSVSFQFHFNCAKSFKN